MPEKGGGTVGWCGRRLFGCFSASVVSSASRGTDRPCWRLQFAVRPGTAPLYQPPRASTKGHASLEPRYVQLHVLPFHSKSAPASTPLASKLATSSQTEVPDVRGALGRRLALHQAEADAAADLRRMESTLQSCEHHFHSVRRQHSHREEMLTSPVAGELDIQLDFMENMTLPLGPEEVQDWFWATARESVTTLGFFVSFLDSRGVHHQQYYHYISDILDHTSLYAVTALTDLLSRLVELGSFNTLHVWADCGPHFRSYQFLWGLRDLCCGTTLARAFLHFFAEHHGKGRCDGQFGLQRRWVDDWARRSLIDSVDSLAKAMAAGMRETMATDPPPAGPAYYVVLFKPEKPQQTFQVDNRASPLRIEYTYCLLLERLSAGQNVRITDFTYSDRRKRGQGKDCGIAVPREVPGTGREVTGPDADWRRSFRKTRPEHDPLKVDILQRRLAFQQEAKTGRTPRHDVQLVKIQRLERRMAKRQEKDRRQRLACLRSLTSGDVSEPDACSSSSEDSSSSSSSST